MFFWGESLCLGRRGRERGGADVCQIRTPRVTSCEIMAYFGG